MALTRDDLADILALLREHPELRDAVRNELLSDDFLALPAIVRELAQAQARTEARIEELAQAQARAEERIDDLRMSVDQLRLSVVDLVEGMKQITGRVDNLEGWRYEAKFHAQSRVANIVRRAAVVHLGDLEEALDARDEGRVSPAEWEHLQALDFLFRGRLGKGPDAPTVLVTLEVSRTIDSNDVSRSHNRAEILRRCGYDVVAAAGGRRATVDSRALAEALGVTLLIDRSDDDESEAA